MSSGRDRADPDAGVGARRDARVAGPVWQSAVVDGLVAHHAGRRGGEALMRLRDGDWPASSTVGDVYGTWAAARSDAFPDE